MDPLHSGHLLNLILRETLLVKIQTLAVPFNWDGSDENFKPN